MKSYHYAPLGHLPWQPGGQYQHPGDSGAGLPAGRHRLVPNETPEHWPKPIVSSTVCLYSSCLSHCRRSHPYSTGPSHCHPSHPSNQPHQEN